MDNNINKNKLPSNDSSPKPMFLSGKIVNPKRDWSILITLFIVFIIASVGFDFYMYKKIVSGNMYVSVDKAELIIENLKAGELQRILNNFENKKLEIANLKLEKLVDPSI